MARAGNYMDGPKGLGASIELNFEGKGNEFRLQIPFKPTTQNFQMSAGVQWVNFGIDVFMNSNTNEGMCVQMANKAYTTHLKSQSSQPFEMQCTDNGDGTFKPGVIPDPVHPLSGCNELKGKGRECGGCLAHCNPRSRAATLQPRHPLVW